MANKRNYCREMENIIASLKDRGRVPTLLLHCCCAPCSSSCLEVLTPHFLVTAYYFNPNITDENEYRKRADELLRLTKVQPHENPVRFEAGEYGPKSFFAIAKGLEECPERGERCLACYRLRLRAAAHKAKAEGYDYFATTLTLSPLKDAEALNRIGFELQEETGAAYLPSDFKKKDGYKRSIELSKEHGLYRQDYCGCVFSKRDACAKL